MGRTSVRARANILAGLMLLLCTCLAVAEDRVHQTPPLRVVSLNLCTDELLLLLAQPQQIASVTWLVKDPTLSWFAGQAAHVPENRGLAEEILLHQPDLVLAGEFTTPATVALLQRVAVPLLRLPLATNLAAIEAQITQVAAALGQRERGEQVITNMRERLASLPSLPDTTHGGRSSLTAALFQPNGLTATADTLIHDAMQMAGLENLAVNRNLPIYAQLPLETLLFEQPDLLVMNNYEQKMPSLAQELMRHPALAHAFTPARTVVVPSQAWSCGTPNFVEAVEILRMAALQDMAKS